MTIDLPQPYRADEVWAFHARDSQALAEYVRPNQIRKGCILRGRATVVKLRLEGRLVHCCAEVDGPPIDLDREVEAVAQRLLGLSIDPVPFEQALAQDRDLGPLIQQRPGLRIAQTATPFEALSWAIMGQQVHLNFALVMRRTFIQQAGRRHSSGLWCYPGPADVAKIDPAWLHAQKFSRAKAHTLTQIASQVASGALHLDHPDIAAQLLSVKGIGPWTVNYTLLRGYGQADCSLHGDAAVKNALQRVFDRTLDAAQAHRLLERYRPYRSLAAAHFWASL